ncbi:MAG TPA: hypothetical protein VGJ31_17300 [Dongiaceae bacterium]|jgi:hypothetical protein
MPNVKLERNDEQEAARLEGRRAILRKAGRFIAVTAPAVTLLLAAPEKPAKAAPISVS